MAKIKVPSEMNLQCKNPLEMGKELPKIWASNGGVGITPKLICSPANTIIQLTDENHTMLGAMQRYKQIETSDDLTNRTAMLNYGSPFFPYIKSDGTVITTCSIGPLVFQCNDLYSNHKPLGNNWTIDSTGFHLVNGLGVTPYCYVSDLLGLTNYNTVDNFYLSMKSEVKKIVEKQKIDLTPRNFYISGDSNPEEYRLAIVSVNGPVDGLRLFCLTYLTKDVWYYHGTFNDMHTITSAYQYLFLHNETNYNFFMLM